MIIDIHTHIGDKDKWKSYQEKSKGLVKKVVALSWYNKKDIEELLEFTENEPDVYAAGSIDMDKGIEEQLSYHEKLFKDGKIVGIKLYPGYQHFYPSDPKVVDIARLCEKYDKPLIFHSGDFYDPEGVSLLKYAQSIHVDELAISCPGTKIVISHFGFPYLLETANIVAKNQNVYTDISGTIAECDTPQDLERLVEQYTSDLRRIFNYFPEIKKKTMFGTDYGGEDSPLNHVQPYIKVIEELMTKEEQEQAFFKLGEKLYFNSGN